MGPGAPHPEPAPLGSQLGLTRSLLWALSAQCKQCYFFSYLFLVPRWVPPLQVSPATPQNLGFHSTELEMGSWPGSLQGLSAQSWPACSGSWARLHSLQGSRDSRAPSLAASPVLRLHCTCWCREMQVSSAFCSHLSTLLLQPVLAEQHPGAPPVLNCFLHRSCPGSGSPGLLVPWRQICQVTGWGMTCLKVC